MIAVVAQGLGIYDEQMLSSRLLYLSEFVKTTWEAKKAAIDAGEVYIGG